MNLLIKIKRKVGMHVKEGSISAKILYGLNLLLFHQDDREKLVHYGNEDPDHIYYVIRPTTNTEGLLSTYFYVSDCLKEADKKGYISYVDFESKRCQYFTGEMINGTTNAWEYYFEQPYNIDKLKLKEKKNVLLGGVSTKKNAYVGTKFQRNIDAFIGDVYRERCIKLRVRNDILNEAQRRYNQLFGNRAVLGVLIRGTDYISLKPKGHPIQPTIDDVVGKIDEFKVDYEIDYIYVVTEEYEYFRRLHDQYGDVVITNDNDFIKNYKQGTFISDSFVNDPYLRGKNYLIRLLLLSKCDYLIAGLTNGSLFAYCQKNEPYKDLCFFDLGLYE